MLSPIRWQEELVKALFPFIGSLLILAAGWGVGQKLTLRWNLRQKQRELQLAATQQFYGAYGEFFAVWKLWNRLDRSPILPNDERAWELQKRAAAAEAIVEGLLVKISSELILDRTQLATLARFRQAFQQLRQSIRSGRLLDWHSADHPEYKTFKELAVKVAKMLAGEWPLKKVPSLEQASDQLVQITSNRWEHNWITGSNINSDRDG